MDYEPLPTIVLRVDPLLGCYARVPAAEEDEMFSVLTDAKLSFELDPPAAARIAEPGQSVVVFGAQHPVGVRDVLRDWEYEAEIDPSVVLPEQSYHPPVAALLELGEPSASDATVDCAALGLGREHVPELVRMAVDPELHTGPQESPIVWAPLHAWRALAALGAEEAVVPLVGLLARLDEGHDEWIGDELPRLLARFGQPALQPAANCLADPRRGMWTRVAAANLLSHLGREHPELRAECVVRVAGQLEQFATQGEGFNGMLVSDLMDLKAVEAAPVMERAFASGRVDEACSGDWEDVQIELGLKTHREHTPKPNRLTKLGEQFRAAAMANDLQDRLDNDALDLPPVPYVAPPKVGRNDPCPCGSGKKYKQCCGR